MTERLNKLLLKKNLRTNDQVFQQCKDEWRMRPLDHLLKAVCDAAVSNTEAQVVPVFNRWTGHSHQREAAIHILQPHFTGA